MKNMALHGRAGRNNISEMRIVWEQEVPERMIREVGIETKACPGEGQLAADFDVTAAKVSAKGYV